MVKKKQPAKKEVVGSGAGISGSKPLEGALANSEERYRTILEQMQDSYYEVDLAGDFTFVSDSFCANLGYAREELLRINYRLITADKDIKPTFLVFNQVYKTGEPNKGFVNQVIRKNGNVNYYESSVAPQKNERGETIGFRCVGRDITERRRGEETLRESEERYRSILEQMYDHYYEVDLAGNFTFLNESTCRKFGYSREELIGKSYRLIVPEDDIKRLFAASKAVFKSGEPNKCYSHSILRKDGSIVFGESFIDIRRNKQGETIGFRTVSRDVTERKQAEEALRESEEKYRTILEQMRDGYYEVDLAGNFTFVNDASCLNLGYSREELIGNNFRLALSENEAKAVFQAYHEVYLSGELNKGFTFEVERKDGTIGYAESSIALKENEQGEIIGFRSVSRDVTERKQAGEALSKSHKQLTAVLDSLDSLVYVVDFDSYEILFINKYGRYVWGDVQGQKCWNSIQKDQKGPCSFCTNSRLVSEMGLPTGVYQWEFLNTVNGRWYDCQDQAIPWIDRVLVRMEIATDITDRKRLEEELQRVEKLESIGTLAGGIAHNFNNLLTMILGNISLASMDAAPGSEIQESLEQAEKASLRAKDLTLQLLTFSKGGAPVKEIASLTELLKDTAGSALGGSNVKCRFSIPDDLWQAEIDARQVSQVIYNLVINAQQSMPAGGTIELSAENIAINKTQRLGKGLPIIAGDYVRVAITDHGSGIPKEHLEKIFDPFFTTKINAIGLGVATAFSIARQHGGHLSVESKVGSGSTFYLYLPASAPKQAIKDQVKPAVKARILVMDDEQGVREVAGRMLKHIGYEDVECAADGAEAIKLYKSSMKSGNPFGVAILDLTIPGGMGGEVTIQKLLDIDPEVKAIVSSGYIDDPVMAGYSEYGFSGMITKPYTLEELRKAVQDVIG